MRMRTEREAKVGEEEEVGNEREEEERRMKEVGEEEEEGYLQEGVDEDGDEVKKEKWVEVGGIGG